MPTMPSVFFRERSVGARTWPPPGLRKRMSLSARLDVLVTRPIAVEVLPRVYGLMWRTLATM